MYIIYVYIYQFNLSVFRLIKCKVSAEDKKLYLFHSYDDTQGICREHRLETKFVATHPDIVIEYKTFRFNGIGGADQKQTVACSLMLEKAESITTATTIPDCASDCRDACSCDETTADCQADKDAEAAYAAAKAAEEADNSNDASSDGSDDQSNGQAQSGNAAGLGKFCIFFNIN